MHGNLPPQRGQKATVKTNRATRSGPSIFLASVGLLVEQLHRETGVARQALWSNMRSTAALDLKTTRELWRKEA